MADMNIQFDELRPQQFNVFMVTQLAPQTFVDGIAGLDFVVIPPHSVSEIHRHNHSDNLVYVIKGSGKASVDGELHAVKPGMRIIIPKGVAHGFRTAEEQLEFISIQVPPILNEAKGIFDRDILE